MFYDLNSLANRHLPANIRIILVNNGKGTEFRNYNHPAARFGDDADVFMAAAGHYGNKSSELIKNFVTDLGFIYISANSKEEYLQNLEMFVSPQKYDKPVFFEVFTNSADESDAVEYVHNLEEESQSKVKKAVKAVVGDKVIGKIRDTFK